jgi:RNA polymerase sigma-B factor
MTRQQQESQNADRLWAEYVRAQDPRTRDAIVRQFEPLAHSLARRYARSGPQAEDLAQVALIGLVKAVDRFDPTTRNRFATFAVPSILGELRHYFRDHGWTVHVPRQLQELARQVKRAELELADRLNREPTGGEIAARLELSEERVQEGRRVLASNALASLQGYCEGAGWDGSPMLHQGLGMDDPELARAEARVSMQQALSNLRGVLRQIVALRYFRGMSQREVAKQLGCSPMQICRLEKQALAQLRQHLSAA